MNKINSLSDLHGVYAISKTLKFKLKPVGETQHFIDENKMVLLGKQRNTDYKEIKVFLDEVHSKFINQSLSDLSLIGIKEFEEKFKEFQNTPKKERKKIEEALEKIKNSLKKQITDKLNKSGDELGKHINSKGIKVSGKGIDILFGKNIIDILKIYFPGNEKLFNSFDKFLGLLKDYNTSRLYIYSKGLQKRLIDENLLFYIQNKIVYDKFYRDSNINFSSVEKELGFKMTDIFDINFTNSLLNQKGIDLFNSYIGGITNDKGVKVKGINEVINEEKQRLYSEYMSDLVNDIENNFKKENFPMFKFLFKQILSQKEEIKEAIGNDNELLKRLTDFSTQAENKVKLSYNILEKLLDNKDVHYSKDGVYLSKKSLNTIIPKLFINSNDILVLFKKYSDFISLFDIKKELNAYKENTDNLFKEKYTPLVNNSIYNSFCSIMLYELSSSIHKIEEAKTDIMPLSNVVGSSREYKAIKIMKYLECILNYYQQTQYFSLEKSKELIRDGIEYDIDNSFYNEFDLYYSDFQILNCFNDTRNYIVKKPFSQNKFLLHFENPEILAGWDINKEETYGTVLFKKDGNYFLGISNKGTKLKMDNGLVNGNEEYYEKFNSRFLGDPVKTLPRICFSEKNKKLFNPTNKLIKIRENETFRTGENFNKNDLIAIIDFYKDCIKKYEGYKIFTFNFSESSKYNTITDFYNEVKKSYYEVWTTNISKDYIDEKVSKGELYLFQIYTMDFSPYSNGNKKLNTLFLEGVFNNPDMLRINGEGTIFFRPQSIEKKENSFNKAQKYRRYTEDTMLLHLKVGINYSKDEGGDINELVNNYIAENKNSIRVLSLDRGEKNLITYTLLEGDNIIEKGNFNVINNIDYLGKLKSLSKDRKKSQKNYLDIQKIKDLKNGYVGHLVGEIVKKAFENNAIIVLEDLTSAFKQSRINIDFSIYQKIEDALIKKLNYLSFRSIKQDEVGSYAKGLQLTNPFGKQSGKQNGIIFYVNPVNTSTTCPKCGWKKDLYLKYKNSKTAINDFSKFDKIYFDKSENNFVFMYNLKKFGIEKDLEISINSNRDRIITQRKKDELDNFVSENIDVTKNIKTYFDEAGIEYSKGENLINSIISNGMYKNTNQKNIFQNLYDLINLINQIRNSITGENTDDADYISCPCCSFDSRNIKGLLKNGDENGAYNIGRKGLILLDNIYEWYKNKENKYPNLIITNELFEKYYRK